MTITLASQFAQRLQQRREDLSSISLSRQQAVYWIEELLGLLFPQLEAHPSAASEVPLRLQDLQGQLEHIVHKLQFSEDLVLRFFEEDLPQIDQLLQEDAQALLAGDPAATCLDEVIMGYPGFIAVSIYRVAHVLHRHEVPLLPRILTEHAHQLTGVDIHPGAQIGRRFCIDHATGVVIGESTVIGEDVKIYQGVTLGALSVEKSMAKTKRHPTLGDRVVVYANATILGGQTHIGDDSIIGGNVWLTRSVPAGSRIYHAPQQTLRTPHER